MDSHSISRKAPRIRHKCVACYKMYNNGLHLVEHMKSSFHSVHQPRYGVCLKHCKSFESVREHLNAPDHVYKGKCKTILCKRGCSLCLRVFEEASTLAEHKSKCRLSAPLPLGTASQRNEVNASSGSRWKTVALDCEMVGGGDDGLIDLCASICLIDEDENVILNTRVQPQAPVTNYRHEITGLTEEDLKNVIAEATGGSMYRLGHTVNGLNQYLSKIIPKRFAKVKDPKNLGSPEILICFLRCL